MIAPINQPDPPRKQRGIVCKDVKLFYDGVEMKGVEFVSMHINIKDSKYRKGKPPITDSN